MGKYQYRHLVLKKIQTGLTDFRPRSNLTTAAAMYVRCYNFTQCNDVLSLKVVILTSVLLLLGKTCLIWRLV